MSAERASQLVEAGVWLQATGDVEGARRLFEQALKLDPANARAQQFLAPPAGAVRPALAAVPPPGSNPFQRQAAPRPAPSPAPAPAPAVAPLVPDIDLGTSWADAISPEIQWAPGQSAVELPDDASSGWDTGSKSGLEVHSLRPDRTDPLALLKDPSRPPTEPPAHGQVQAELEALLSGAEDLLELDDHSGAMELILKAERLRTGDPRVEALKRKSEQILEGMYESKLGALDRFPRVVLKDDEIIWLNLDHRAGFVLAQIDGSVSYEDVFAVSGMSRLDTARILAQLLDEGVIVPG